MKRVAARLSIGGNGDAMIVHTAQDAASLLLPLIGESADEDVAVILLDDEHRLLALVLEQRGARDAVELPVRRILAHALSTDARALVLGHNHPSGDPAPSEADRAATRRLAGAAAVLDIRLFDHLIFGGGHWVSFRALGLL